MYSFLCICIFLLGNYLGVELLGHNCNSVFNSFGEYQIWGVFNRKNIVKMSVVPQINPWVQSSLKQYANGIIFYLYHDSKVLHFNIYSEYSHFLKILIFIYAVSSLHMAFL